MLYSPTATIRKFPFDCITGTELRRKSPTLATDGGYSIVETFPLAHTKKSGDFPQREFIREIRVNPEFRKLMKEYLVTMLDIERRGQVRNGYIQPGDALCVTVCGELAQELCRTIGLNVTEVELGGTTQCIIKTTVGESKQQTYVSLP